MVKIINIIPADHQNASIIIVIMLIWWRRKYSLTEPLEWL